MIDNSNTWLKNTTLKLNDLAKEGSIDLSGIKLSDNESLNNLKIISLINSKVNKKYKNTGKFKLTDFEKKVYKEKNKFILKYIKGINKGKIDGKYIWDVDKGKPSISFEISGKVVKFHTREDFYLLPEKIKRKLKEQ